MTDELLKPAEVCKRLGMPPSTLRIYSTKFAPLLSDGAKRPTMGPDGRSGSRIYNSRDLLLLSRAKELLAQGMTYDQTLAELRLSVPGVRARLSGEAGEKEPEERGGEEQSGRGFRSDEVTQALVETLRMAVANGEKALEALRVMQEREAREIGELRDRIERVERGLMEVMVEMEKRGSVGKGWRQRFFGG